MFIFKPFSPLLQTDVLFFFFTWKKINNQGCNSLSILKKPKKEKERKKEKTIGVLFQNSALCQTSNLYNILPCWFGDGKDICVWGINLFLWNTISVHRALICWVINTIFWGFFLKGRNVDCLNPNTLKTFIQIKTKIIATIYGTLQCPRFCAN